MRPGDGEGAFRGRRLSSVVLTPEERHLALALPRRAIERALGPHAAEDPAAPFADDPMPPVFEERRGVFVTLTRRPTRALRGCIGYPLPTLPLRRALPRAAVAAALEDPRFPPVRAEELRRLAIEVSVLTVPVAVPGARPADVVTAIRVGRDGVIVEGLGTSGLLLPQVAVEQGWSVEELLEGTCAKAGLPPTAWRDPRVTVRRFEAEVFHEGSPGETRVLARDRPSATGAPLVPRN